jgi:hypothetical protein
VYTIFEMRLDFHLKMHYIDFSLNGRQSLNKSMVYCRFLIQQQNLRNHYRKIIRIHYLRGLRGGAMGLENLFLQVLVAQWGNNLSPSYPYLYYVTCCVQSSEFSVPYKWNTQF